MASCCLQTFSHPARPVADIMEGEGWRGELGIVVNGSVVRARPVTVCWNQFLLGGQRLDHHGFCKNTYGEGNCGLHLGRGVIPIILIGLGLLLKRGYL